MAQPPVYLSELGTTPCRTRTTVDSYLQGKKLGMMSAKVRLAPMRERVQDEALPHVRI